MEETPVHKRMEEVVTMLDMSTGTSPLALTSSASKDAVKEEEKESDTEGAHHHHYQSNFNPLPH